VNRVSAHGNMTRWQSALRTLLYGRGVNRNVKAKARLGLAVVAFAGIYCVIALRLVMFAAAGNDNNGRHSISQDAVATARPDILDRNGEIIATDVKAPSLYAEPRKLIDRDEAEELLTATLPDLDAKEVRSRLASKRGFVWLKRELTPRQEQEIHRLGIPGIGFLTENKRVYPNGATVSQLIGLVDIDNKGIAGIEQWLDSQGLAALHMAGLATDRLEPVTLSLDLRVQFALRDELTKAREKFKAKAAAGVVLNVNTGEVLALVSEPDYDPNNPREAHDPDRINRMTTGVYEMGSTFKALTLAMALDSGRVNLNSTFDARTPLRFGRFTIHDYHAQNRILTMPEVFTYSSNKATARMALSFGVDYHKAYLAKMGQLTKLQTELPGAGDPHWPKKHWGELNTATIAFGHGLSVAPLQAAMGVAATVNGGFLITPTFLKRSPEQAMRIAQRVLKPETSQKMRYLMRLNAEKGTATFANVPGYYIGGKTGTAEKVINGRYSQHRLMTDFMAILPADKPQYLLLIMLDEPQPTKETHGFATAGWNAGPTAAKVIERVAPLLDLEPRFNLPDADRLILAKATETR